MRAVRRLIKRLALSPVVAVAVDGAPEPAVARWDEQQGQKRRSAP